jgi:hypothetical protein
VLRTTPPDTERRRFEMHGSLGILAPMLPESAIRSRNNAQQRCMVVGVQGNLQNMHRKSERCLDHKESASAQLELMSWSAIDVMEWPYVDLHAVPMNFWLTQRPECLTASNQR